MFQTLYRLLSGNSAPARRGSPPEECAEDEEEPEGNLVMTEEMKEALFPKTSQMISEVFERPSLSRPPRTPRSAAARGALDDDPLSPFANSGLPIPRGGGRRPGDRSLFPAVRTRRFHPGRVERRRGHFHEPGSFRPLERRLAAALAGYLRIFPFRRWRSGGGPAEWVGPPSVCFARANAWRCACALRSPRCARTAPLTLIGTAPGPRGKPGGCTFILRPGTRQARPATLFFTSCTARAMTTPHGSTPAAFTGCWIT